MATYEHPVKCIPCGLHFVVLSWDEDWWQKEDAVFCPECGTKGGKLRWKDGVYYLENGEAAYYGPPSKGLWQMLNGEWWRVSRVQCSDAPDATYHASIDGKRSLCGRPVVFNMGATDTDSPSMIWCHSCKASLR